MTTLSDIFPESEQPHWVSRAAFPVVVAMFFLNQVFLATAVYHGYIWLAVLLALTASHLMHGVLIAFHEASHGLLRKNRRINEIDGIIIGVLSLMSFNLYRVAHQLHHAHLATEEDAELWPFVVPGIPRWQRILAAVLELSCGLLFTPFLFLRVFLRKNSAIRNPKMRRRIWRELALMTVSWTAILSAVAWFGVWKYFIWLYVVPAYIAGNLQSCRKYIEHVGLTGNTPISATRSIVANDVLGRFVAFTLLHEPFHGVHHRHAGLPHAELPLHTSELNPVNPGDVPIFSSYGHAFLDLIRKLSDPRAGSQWQKVSSR